MITEIVDKIPDSNWDTDTGKKVIRLRRANCYMTATEIGHIVGVSRERVRQILDKNNLRTSSIKRKNLTCLNCGGTFSVGIASPARRFCSTKCSYEYCNPLVECGYCHAMFRRKQSQICCKLMKHTGYFCNKTCFGHYVAEHYGRAKPVNFKEIIEVKLKEINVNHRLPAK
jgi:hypothetical protein